MPLDTIKVIDTIYTKVANTPPQKSVTDIAHNIHWWCLIISVLIIQIIFFRPLNSFFNCLEVVRKKKRTPTDKFVQSEHFPNSWRRGKIWRSIYWGFDIEHNPNPDFWYNTIIGFVELIAFTIILKSEQYTIIGAWLGFKIVCDKWNAPKEGLNFNGFLMNNVLIIAISFVLMLCFITH